MAVIQFGNDFLLQRLGSSSRHRLRTTNRSLDLVRKHGEELLRLRARLRRIHSQPTSFISSPFTLNFAGFRPIQIIRSAL